MFWPILVCYFIALFIMTMRRQIQYETLTCEILYPKFPVKSCTRNSEPEILHVIKLFGYFIRLEGCLLVYRFGVGVRVEVQGWSATLGES